MQKKCIWNFPQGPKLWNKAKSCIQFAIIEFYKSRFGLFVVIETLYFASKL